MFRVNPFRFSKISARTSQTVAHHSTSFLCTKTRICRRHCLPAMAACSITPLLAGPARFTSAATRTLQRNVTKRAPACPSHLGLPAQRSLVPSQSPSPAARFTTAAAGDDGLTVQKTEEEWRAILTPEQFRILRLKGTEYDKWHLQLCGCHDSS